MKSSIFIVFLLVFLSFDFSKASTGFKQQGNSSLKDLCAHRGTVENHRENIITAFEEALGLSAQKIEFDLLLSKDNQLVIRHNAIKRTFDGTGYIHKTKLQELKTLEIENWKSLIAAFPKYNYTVSFKIETASIQMINQN